MCDMCQMIERDSEACAFETTTVQAALAETTDAAAGTATSYTIQVGDSFSGAISSAGDQDAVRLWMDAGASYQITLTGGTLADPFVSLLNSDGQTLAYDDDDGDGAVITHTATSSGYYYIQAQDAFDMLTGSYTLNVVQTAAPSLPADGSLDEMADYLVNGYWSDLGSSARSFDTSGSNVITYDLQGLSAEGQQLALWAMAAWEAVADVQFSAATGTADIVFDDSQSGAFTSLTTSGSDIVQSVVNISSAWLTSYGTTLDSYSFQTYVHELGHALGLGHMGNYDGTASFPNDATFGNDSWQLSVMSYFSQTDNYTTSASYAGVVSAMLADVIAIQSIYGASTLFAGDTYYGAGASSAGYLSPLFDALVPGTSSDLYGGNPVALTIYDGGGLDTIDVSYSTADQVLSLLAESFSNIAGLVGNLAIARDTVIEDGITGEGNDFIIGNAAANRLAGNGGDDTLDGGDGDDTLAGGAGADLLLGGAGNDFYMVDNAADVVLETVSTVDLSDAGGNDTIFSSVSFSLAASVGTGFVEDLTLTGSAVDGRGNALANTITGNSLANRLDGGLGNDTLRGEGGNDALWGQDGDDRLEAGDGDDFLAGETGADELFGGLGNDSLFGGSENDTLRGEDGNDTLWGEDGDDRLEAGDGADFLFGGVGNDVLFGATGNDTLSGEDGDDFLAGEAGDDDLFGGLGNDLMLGGTENDTIRGDAGNDTLWGEDGDDRLEAGDGADFLGGGAGNDQLFASTGNDTLRGEDGDDFLAGEAGDDDLYGGLGNDLLLGGSESDTLRGDDGNDTLWGETGDDRLESGDGADFLFGGLGNDQLFGASGNDVMFGGEGGDFIAGEAGDDDIYGGADNDMLLGGTENDTIRGEDGNDTLWGEAGDDRLEAGDGADVLDGGAGNDQLFAATGDDTLYGGDGGDFMAGEAGDDLMYGGADNDLLLAGADNDTLVGGAGNDTLYGESGADHFVFATGDGADVIADFLAAAGDLIDLTGLSAVTDFTDLMSYASTISGSTLLDFGAGDSLTLNGYTAPDLEAGWFLFA
ncbi:serralysin [Rhodobacter aestuarii]|uniref:Serralysin n=2 Tax=Rhodobacter aestuarii TaxID=453582 RepID=A0A1N7LD64_9RHOB|nr:serralysin [Rhodobacter aestuarii]SIS71731.1 serralysin [Rhodobacter aestuarii]